MCRQLIYILLNNELGLQEVSFRGQKSYKLTL